MATAPAPGALEAKLASRETQLANVTAQAEADAETAEHLSQAMEQRYATLAAEHAKVRARGLERTRSTFGGRAHDLATVPRAFTRVAIGNDPSFAPRSVHARRVSARNCTPPRFQECPSLLFQI